MRVLVVLSVVSACSFALGTPAKHGWPSGEPDDYAFWQSYNCYVYEKSFAFDLVATIVGVAITAVAELGDRRSFAIGAGGVTAPFLASTIAGGVGRSRCYRWAYQQQLEPNGPDPTPIPAGGSGE